MRVVRTVGAGCGVLRDRREDREVVRAPEHAERRQGGERQESEPFHHQRTSQADEVGRNDERRARRGLRRRRAAAEAQDQERRARCDSGDTHDEADVRDELLRLAARDVARLVGRAGVARARALEAVVRRLLHGAEDAEDGEPGDADSSRDVRVGAQLRPAPRRRLDLVLGGGRAVAGRYVVRRGGGGCRRRRRGGRRLRVQLDGGLLSERGGYGLARELLARRVRDDHVGGPGRHEDRRAPLVGRDRAPAYLQRGVGRSVRDDHRHERQLRVEVPTLCRRGVHGLLVAGLLGGEQRRVVERLSILGPRPREVARVAQRPREQEARVRAVDDVERGAQLGLRLLPALRLRRRLARREVAHRLLLLRGCGVAGRHAGGVSGRRDEDRGGDDAGYEKRSGTVKTRHWTSSRTAAAGDRTPHDPRLHHPGTVRASASQHVP